MQRSTEYLESKIVGTEPVGGQYVTIEHANTYGKMVEIEREIELIKDDIHAGYEPMMNSIRKVRIKELESELEALMKS